MDDEIVNNFELKPVIIGAVISLIFILIFPGGIWHLLWVIIGSAVAGYMSENTTKYAIIYGAIIGLISSFLMLSVFSMPLYIILGIFGGFVGKLVHFNLE